MATSPDPEYIFRSALHILSQTLFLSLYTNNTGTCYLLSNTSYSSIRMETLMQYLLLPFTHSIDREAIDQALVMAENLSACLVCVAFIPCAPDKHKGIRLERIQQAKDFLEYMYYRARQTGV